MRQSIEDLLTEYRKGKQPYQPQRLVFEGVDGYDVYNPSVPFMYEGKELILARVEKRDSEVSKAIFFENKQGIYHIRKDIEPLDLQDPCITLINENWIIGGTYVYHENNQTFWYTKFYKGTDLNHLTPFLDAPLGMKDVRLIELSDHRVAVFTRPQGIKGGRGQIGFVIANSLADVTTQLIDDAPLLEQFTLDEWGGANHLLLIDEQTIGVLGHIARFSGDHIRHYYAMTFTINLQTKKATPMKIIAERKNFLEGPAKRDDLIDVLFSAGIVRNDDLTATLYVGVSDCEIQSILLDDPFLSGK